MAESLHRLTDIEIRNKLLQFGFPNTPVTETTRPILIKKLMKHIKTEKLKRGKISNYVLHSNSNNKEMPNTNVTPSVPIQKNMNLFENGNGADNNNEIKVCRNPSVYFNKSDANINLVQNSASRMYAPPPVLASNYDNEPHTVNVNVSGKYRKMRSMPCALDPVPAVPVPVPYVKLNEANKANMCDGGVVNRLLSFRDTSIQKKFNSKDAYSSVPVSKGIIRNEMIKKFVNFDFKSFLKKPDISQYIIPHVLIASLIIFLSVISVLYAAKKFDLSPISQTNLSYTICSPNDMDDKLQLSSSITKIDCISEDQFNKAMYIIEELFKYLNERARLHHCIDTDHSPTLDIFELMNALSSNANIQNGNLQKKLLDAQYLIEQNPQWMIRAIVPMENSSEESLSFELIEPNLPLKCIIFKKIARFFTVIGLLILIALCCLIVYFLIVLYRYKQKESMLATEELIKDITNELMYQSSQSENSEVIINHLQEKLLPAHKRSKLLGPWKKALKILEGNDNRVLFGMIIRNGEQLRTMTWNKNLGNKEPVTSKKWQSSAFDNSNKIVNPPTSCLKIRHMFDPSEIEQPNLRQLIVESIFEKVGSNCKIYDVQLDTQSCCVYIRCATEGDAGMVHNEINGWWFDKRLISIKFLRLERFLSRFPKSLADPYKLPNVIKI